MSRRRSAVLAVGAFTLTRLCFVAPPPAVHQPYLGRAVGACGSRSGGWSSRIRYSVCRKKQCHVSGRPGCVRAGWRCRRVAAASTTSAPWPAEGIGGTSLLMYKVCARDVARGPVLCQIVYDWVPAWCSQCLVCEVTRTLMPSTTPC